MAESTGAFGDRFRLRRRPRSTPLRERSRRRGEIIRRERSERPPLAQALRQAMAWQALIEEQGLTRADIARREICSRAWVTQVLSLLDLPDDFRQRLLAHDPTVTSLTLRQALKMTRAV